LKNSFEFVIGIDDYVNKKIILKLKLIGSENII